MSDEGMSRLSGIGLLLIAISIAPFALLCIADALGWTGPSTGCGFVALAVVGGAFGTVMFLIGLLASPRETKGTGTKPDDRV